MVHELARARSFSKKVNGGYIAYLVENKIVTLPISPFAPSLEGLDHLAKRCLVETFPSTLFDSSMKSLLNYSGSIKPVSSSVDACITVASESFSDEVVMSMLKFCTFYHLPHHHVVVADPSAQILLARTCCIFLLAYMMNLAQEQSASAAATKQKDSNVLPFTRG